MAPEPRIRVSAVLRWHGRILLCRHEKRGKEYWLLPGGGLEPNESLFECGEREVMEETGLTVKVISVAFLREWIVPKYCVVPHETGVGFGLEVYLYAELVGDRTETRIEPGRIEVPHWIPLDQVAALPLWPKELKTLANWLAAGNKPLGVHSFIAQMENPNTPAPNVNFP